MRKLERERPGQTTGELSRAVSGELAMKRTRRAAELVAEAIRMSRAREPRRDHRLEVAGQHTGSPELGAQRRLEPGSDGTIPEQAITAYNQTHPDRPY